MLTVFDREAVKVFVSNLESYCKPCSDEGSFCSELDETLDCHVRMCDELWSSIARWAQEIYEGKLEFDSTVELLFKNKLQHTFDEIRNLTQEGQAIESECFELLRLSDLVDYCDKFEFALKNWVSPKRSISPAPRLKNIHPFNDDVAKIVAELPPLPAGWKPANSSQAKRFDRPKPNNG